MLTATSPLRITSISQPRGLAITALATATLLAVAAALTLLLPGGDRKSPQRARR